MTITSTHGVIDLDLLKQLLHGDTIPPADLRPRRAATLPRAHHGHRIQPGDPAHERLTRRRPQPADPAHPDDLAVQRRDRAPLAGPIPARHPSAHHPRRLGHIDRGHPLQDLLVLLVLDLHPAPSSPGPPVDQHHRDAAVAEALERGRAAADRADEDAAGTLLFEYPQVPVLLVFLSSALSELHRITA